MMTKIRKFSGIMFSLVLVAGCTVKAVGDPDRPITINANVVVDIRGLKETATGIEDLVAQGGK
ncbi:MAG: YnbE family lipoprotein [Candidatus Marinimicrobia bacterium]|jgi:hypothetical protein|nr:YnbE family lipoprotein [Candidatus Neomarinimicrobiota bacterium]